MSQWMPVPLLGGAYADDTRPWSSQDVVNWLPAKAERPGARSDIILRTPPGLTHFAGLWEDIEGDKTPTGPVRGLHNAEGALFAVAGNGLYRVYPDGSVRYIGDIPGAGRVSMTHNQVTGGNQVVIANGQNAYVYNTKDDSFTRITDEGFPGARVVDFVDGYIAFTEPFGRFWGHSELVKAGEYNTLDRYEAESAPDRIVTLVVSHREVIVFGERTAEIFRNTGAATGTFQRADGTEMERGCAGPFAVARLDNTVYWLGNDGIVYRLDGYQPVRVSTAPIEQAIAGFNWKQAFAMTWEDRGHKVFYLTFLDGITIGYDVATGEWHRRESYGLKRWRLSALVNWNGGWYGGDYTTGRLYRLDWDVATEAWQPMIGRRRSAVAHADGNRVAVAGLKLVFDTGRSDVGNLDHYVSVRYSDDGGHNFNGARLASLGKAGQYRTTVEMYRLGQAEQRVWEIEAASPVKRDFIAASAQVKV